MEKFCHKYTKIPYKMFLTLCMILLCCFLSACLIGSSGQTKRSCFAEPKLVTVSQEHKAEHGVVAVSAVSAEAKFAAVPAISAEIKLADVFAISAEGNLGVKTVVAPSERDILRTDYAKEVAVFYEGSTVAVALLTEPIYFKSERNRIKNEIVATLLEKGFDEIYVSFDARTFYKLKRLDKKTADTTLFAINEIKKTAIKVEV